MNMFVKVARWIAFLPGAAAAHIFGTWAFFFGISYGIPNVANTVRYASDFGGHIFYGPLIILTWFAVSTGAATYAGITIAPSHRKIAAGILGAALTIFLVLGILGAAATSTQHPMTWQMIFRLAFEVMGMLLGFAVGLSMARQSDKFESSIEASMER